MSEKLLKQRVRVLEAHIDVLQRDKMRLLEVQAQLHTEISALRELAETRTWCSGTTGPQP